MISKRLFIYLLVAIGTFCVILYVRNPDLLQNIWLWIIGLAGTIVAYADTLWKSFIQKFRTSADPLSSPTNKAAVAPLPPDINAIKAEKKTSEPAKIPVNILEQTAFKNEIASLKQVIADKDSENKYLKTQLAQKPAAHGPEPPDDFTGRTIYLLRYLDDGETTLGLLYFNDHFFCYTLEDTFREIKFMSRTRIPAGTYSIEFNKNETDLTKKYRGKNFTKGWFTWHLQLQKVPGFEGIYIHCGGTHEDTAGCILVSNGLSSESTKKILTNSRATFETLYKMISLDLNNNVPVRIRISDESWFNKQKTHNPS